MTYLPTLVALVAYALILTGLTQRKKPTRHGLLMLAAFVLDISLVAVLEIQRNAINTALTHQLNGMQISHILFSTLAVLFYLPTVALGLRRLLSPHDTGPAIRKWHIRFGMITFFFRTLGLLTMFSVVGRVFNAES